jgi:hypothetical protein
VSHGIIDETSKRVNHLSVESMFLQINCSPVDQARHALLVVYTLDKNEL